MVKTTERSLIGPKHRSRVLSGTAVKHKWSKNSGQTQVVKNIAVKHKWSKNSGQTQVVKK